MLGPFATASRFTLSFTKCRYCRHCRTPPAHRCPRRRRRQRQSVTEGTAMAPWNGPNEWVFNKAGVRKELLKTVKAKKLAYYGHAMRKQGTLPGERDNARNKARCTQARKKNTHTQPGWTTSRRGQDTPWKNQSEWLRTEINGESTFIVWPALRSWTAEEQNRTDPQTP